MGDNAVNTRVLVIDDEEIVRDNIEDILIPHQLKENEKLVNASSILFDEQTPGEQMLLHSNTSHLPVFTLDKATNGPDGLQRINRALAEDRPYAVIFLDMRMPGWDGLETAMHIREVDIKAEIIIITAYSDKSIEEIIAKCGTNIGYHCKPYASEEILQLATKAVNDYSKLRNLEKLIAVISNINLSEAHLNSLLPNILDQLAMYIGSDTAILGKLLHNKQYQQLFSIGSIEKEININRIAEIISSVDFDKEEVVQIDEIVFVKLEDYSIFAVLSKALQLKTEKLYLVRLFVQNAARAIKNVQLHEELLKKEKLSAVGKALSILIHDLRAPIKSIPTFTSFIRDDGFQSQWLDMIDLCGEQAAEIFEDFLDFLRDAPLLLQPVAIDKLIIDGIILAKSRMDMTAISIHEEIESNLVTLGDISKLKRVIMNLLVNAAEVLKDKKVQHPAIHITARRVGDSAEIILKDNGPGIPEKIKDSLFDAFVTVDKSQGTGLGLAIVKQYVVAHQGTISVVNNGGAEFVIRLPLTAQYSEPLI